MNKKIVLGVLAGILIIAVLGLAYVLRPTEEASQPIEALPLVEQTEDSNMQDQSNDVAIEDTSPDSLIVFQIVQENSEVRFSLDEILSGNPFTPVGKTNQVAGEIGIDFSNPSASQLGAILINARTFQTDNSNRDRAIKNQILDTGDFEFIRFEPTSISGYPVEIVFGETISLKITGDLTIREITQSVIFEVSIIIVSEAELQGTAFTVVSRADFGLLIPSVPIVAEVSDEVLLEIDFVARSD